MNKKIRDSKFEILRIISMLFIILCHLSLNGNWYNNTGITHFKVMLFHPFGEVGAYLFVLISAYFLSSRITSLKKQLKRIKPLWIKTIFYSWVMLLLTFIFKFVKINFKGIIIGLFPISFNEYWFMTGFIILMLFLQPINNLINKISKREFLIYIFILVFFGAIMPEISGNANSIGGVMGTSILISTYFVGAYIRKYNIKIKNLYVLLIIIGGFLAEYIAMFLLRNKNIIKFNFGLLPLIIATGIFLLFLNFKSFYSKIINWFASGVLASYLITENPLFRLYFWHHIINVGRFQNPTWLFIISGIVIALITVLICSALDHIYQCGYNKIVRRP